MSSKIANNRSGKSLSLIPEILPGPLEIVIDEAMPPHRINPGGRRCQITADHWTPLSKNNMDRGPKQQLSIGGEPRYKLWCLAAVWV